MTSPRHVVVCGAGVVGASVAYYLARRGTGVTVVERSGVACAASGKSGGFLALDWCDGSVLEPLARASFALHARLPEELARDYGYRRMDTFMLAARETGTPRTAHRVPAPAWIDGAGVVTATLGSTETTAQVDPFAFTTALIEGARAHGAKLHIGRVDDLVERDGAVCGVRVDGTVIEADAVVVALGPSRLRRQTSPPTRCSSTTARRMVAIWSRRSFPGPTEASTSAGWPIRRRCPTRPRTWP